MWKNDDQVSYIVSPRIDATNVLNGVPSYSRISNFKAPLVLSSVTTSNGKGGVASVAVTGNAASVAVSGGLNLGEEFPPLVWSCAAVSKVDGRAASVPITGNVSSVPVSGNVTVNASSVPITGHSSSVPITGNASSVLITGNASSVPVTRNASSGVTGDADIASSSFNRVIGQKGSFKEEKRSKLCGGGGDDVKNSIITPKYVLPIGFSSNIPLFYPDVSDVDGVRIDQQDIVSLLDQNPLTDSITEHRIKSSIIQKRATGVYLVPSFVWDQISSPPCFIDGMKEFRNKNPIIN